MVDVLSEFMPTTDGRNQAEPDVLSEFMPDDDGPTKPTRDVLSEFMVDDGGPPARDVLSEFMPDDEGGGFTDTAYAVAADVGEGLLEAPRQVLGGARDAWQEAAEGLESLATWLGDATGLRPFSGFASADERPLPEVGDADSTTGGMVRGISQFLTGFLPVAKAMKVGSAATALGQFGRASAAGAVADATVFDPHEERLSDLVEVYPELRNPVTGYLSADPADSEAEGRFKNAIEGLGLGTVAEGMFQAVRTLKAGRRVRVDQGGPPPKRMGPVTPDDVASPIDTTTISRGKAILEDAAAGRPIDVDPPAAPRPPDGQVAADGGAGVPASDSPRPAASVVGFSQGDRVRLTDPGGPLDGATAEVLGPGGNPNAVMIRTADGSEFAAGRHLLQRADSAPAGGPDLPSMGDMPAARSAGAEGPAPDVVGQGAVDADNGRAVRADIPDGAVSPPRPVDPSSTPSAPSPGGQAVAVGQGVAAVPAAAPAPSLASMSPDRLRRLAQTGDDATREAVRGELRARGVESPDFSDVSDPVAGARAMAEDPPTVAENIARGQAAYDTAAGGDLVRAAMYRQDLGPLAFDFGRLADRVEDPGVYRGAVVEAVAGGKLKGNPASGRVSIEHNGAQVGLNRRNIGGRETWTVDSLRMGASDVPLRDPVPVGQGADQLPTRRIRTASGREMAWRGPVDILTWARSRGGLWDDAGELRTIGLENGARRWVPRERFVGPLVRGDVSERFTPGQASMMGPGEAVTAPGMTLDDATLAAWEAGYFGAREDRPAVQEFLDLLDRASRADSLDNAVLAEADRLDLDAMPSRVNVDEAAYRMGLDTEGLTDAEVSDRVFSEAGRRDGDAALPAEFDQAGSAAGSAISDEGRRALDAVNADGGERAARAGNIRLDKLNTVEDIQGALKATSDENAAFGGARRGVVSDKALSELADDLGTTAKDLANRRVGDAMNAEELLAARRLLADSTEDLVQKARAARGGSDEALAAFQEVYTRHVAIQEAVSGATAEAGRALRQLRIQAASERQRARVVKELIERSGGRDRVEDLADKLASLNDPSSVNHLARQAYRGGALRRGADAIYEYWINSLLSGPTTHVVNITSNALTHLTTLPEEALGAVFGAARRAAGGGADRIYPREAAARAFGLVEGVRDAFRASAKAIRTGEGFDAAYSKLGDGELEGAIPGFIGKVVRIPTRMLEVEDTFFKALAMRPELNALAIRQATKEGLKGDAWARRVGELKAKPTPDMVEDALQKARTVTFTNSLGDTGRAFQHLRRVPGMRWVTPFLKTPVNILTYAARRSPLAPAVKSFREDIAKGGAARDRALAQVTLGTATALAAFSYAREGLITGGGPSDPKEKAALYATGWQPYSIRVGDEWYAYDRLDPAGLLVGVAADMAEAIDAADDKDASDLAAGLVLAFAQTMKDKSYLRGISDTMSAIDDPDRYAGRWLRNFAGSFVPNAVGQYTRASDPVLREVRTFADEFKARLPGSSHTLFPRRDIWGEPITRAEGVAGDGTAARLLTPSRVSRDPTDPVTQEMLRLDLVPTKASRNVRGVELTPAQYDRLQALTGTAARAIVEGIVNLPAYETWSDGMRRLMLDRGFKAARDEARSLFLTEFPEVVSKGQAEKVGATIEGRRREKVTQ